MSNSPFHPRFVRPRLVEALADTPVVLIHGPRQCGKTTLAQSVGNASGYVYISFDSDVLRAAAQADPVGFAADLPDKVVLDEVQRVPELFTALKMAVDSDPHRLGERPVGAEAGGFPGRAPGNLTLASPGAGGVDRKGAGFPRRLVRRRV